MTSPYGCPAVLLLLFNRPEKARAAVERLRAVRPPRLYVVADGPRAHVPTDAAACEAVRLAVRENVDWPCELQLRFRDENYGVRRGVADGIDWFFSHEEQGIILEDDIAAEPQFFPFCAELLERYRDDPRVGSICGTSYWSGPAQFSYHASSFPDIWGWATWRDRWQQYDAEMTAWPRFADEGGLRALPGATSRFEAYWRDLLDRTKAGEIGSWGYRWILTRWSQGTVSLFPTVPLVRNTGFGAGATNTLSSRIPRYCRPPGRLASPLRHPPELDIDPQRERAIWTLRFELSLTDRIVHWLKWPLRTLRRAWSRGGRG